MHPDFGSCRSSIILQDAVEALEDSSDPIETVRDLIRQNRGHWNDALARDTRALFEIQLYGIAGVGVGVEAALHDWLGKARAQIKTRKLAS